MNSFANPRNNLNLGPSRSPNLQTIVKQTPSNCPVFAGFNCNTNDGCNIINIPQQFNSASDCCTFCKENYNANASQYISSDPGAENVFFTSSYHKRCSCIVDSKATNLFNDTFSESQQLSRVSK